MSSFRVGRFSRPEALASIRPELLRQFLSPYESYFRGRSFDLDLLQDGADAETLVSLSTILLNPSTNIPHDLVDALFCIHEVATEKNADLLEMTAGSEGVTLAADSSLVEVALGIWMTNPEALKRIHQRQFSAKVRSFEYFSGEDGVSAELMLNDEKLRQMERSLATYFEKKSRGFGCRIHYYPQDHEHWFLVSHGERFRRQSTWEEGKPGTIAFRPEKYDLVVYHSLTEDLRINAASESLREHYRKQFGFYLFGRENHFPGKSKYTLEPLLRDRDAALLTDDIGGIEWAKLSELGYAIEDAAQEIRTHRAPDVFEALKQHEFELPGNVRLLRASFKIKFADQSVPRSLTIKPSNVALYTRDGDGQLVEEWLVRRGFIKQGKVKGHEQLEHILEVS